MHPDWLLPSVMPDVIVKSVVNRWRDQRSINMEAKAETSSRSHSKAQDAPRDMA